MGGVRAVAFRRRIRMSETMAAYESIVLIKSDEKACSWQAWAKHRNSYGEVTESKEISGTVQAVMVTRTKQDGTEEERLAPVTEVELLGLALLAGITLTQDWVGPKVLEATTAQNGMIKVSLHDWMRAGRLDEGECAFVYAREAWRQILDMLRQNPPGLIVRWTPNNAL